MQTMVGLLTMNLSTMKIKKTNYIILWSGYPPSEHNGRETYPRKKVGKAPNTLFAKQIPHQDWVTFIHLGAQNMYWSRIDPQPTKQGWFCHNLMYSLMNSLHH